MKKVIVNCEKLIEREQAHLYLAQMLDFPEYYGKNLDALYDCLTELKECTLVLQGETELRQAGGYGAKILKVLEEASRANYGLNVVISETELSGSAPSEIQATQVSQSTPSGSQDNKSTSPESQATHINKSTPPKSQETKIFKSTPSEVQETD